MQNYTNLSSASPQLLLFDPADEAALYLPPTGGYFALLTEKASGAKHQDLYPVLQLETVLRLLDPKCDSWISQAQFFTPLRRILNVKSLSLSFLDIDYYKGNFEWAVGRAPEQVAEAFMALCDAEGIPRPSLIVHSGRGIQPKWLYDSPLPRPALPRWNAVEKHLIERLKPYGVDTCVRDAARVLRVVQTVNSRSQTICRVVAVTPGIDGQPCLYSFEYLCECILPKARPDKGKIIAPSATTVKAVRPANGFDQQTLAWARLEDMRTLCAIRGGIQEGMRMSFLMYCMSFLALSHQVDPKTFYREAALVANEIDPNWNFRLAELQTVYEKMLKTRAGERIDFNGRQYVPLYTPRSQTLIDLFEITDSEMASLRSIVTPEERRRRNATAQMKVRRTAGAMPRSEYLNHAKARQERARALRAEGKKVKEIAEEMGLSVRTIKGYLADSKKVQSPSCLLMA